MGARSIVTMKRANPSGGGAVQHTVLLKFTAESSAEQRQTVESRLWELPGLIPEINGFNVLIDLSLDPARSSHLSVVADFDDAEAYAVYASHAAHLAVITECIKPILAPGGRTAIQVPLDAARKQAKRTLRLNTSNKNKLGEFNRLFGQSGIEVDSTKVDLKEIDGTELEVVCHKATCAGEGVLIEDTSLDVEGADVGVNIRWLMDNIGEHEGKKATWRVLLGVMQNGKVLVYEGITEGTITAPAGGGNFGFDPVFKPAGSDKTLAEDKPDSVSARAAAIRALVAGMHKCMMEPLRTEDWKGGWQHDE